MRDSGGVKPAELSFQGHWGFQYYMQSFGSRPIDLDNPDSSSPVMAIPENNTSTLVVPPAFVASKRVVAFKAGAGISTMSVPMGAGFYSDIWGPLPYAFGSVPDERYAIIRLRESDEPPPEGSR
jgi:hypothetical protein